MKISSAGTNLFHKDRRTGITMLIVVFRNFENAPNKITYRHHGSSCGLLQVYIEGTDSTGSCLKQRKDPVVLQCALYVHNLSFTL